MLSVNQLNVLLDALQTNQSINTLDLAHSPLKDEGALILARRLPNLPRITGIDLGACKITTEGAVALAQLSTLNFLSLTGNAILDEGVTALANNTCLSTLYVAACHWGDGAAEVLSNNQNLTNVSYDRNSISNDWSSRICAMLDRNKQAQHDLEVKQIATNLDNYLIDNVKTLVDLVRETNKKSGLAEIIIPYLLEQSRWFYSYVKNQTDLKRFLTTYPSFAKQALSLYFSDTKAEEALALTLDSLIFYSKYDPELIQQIVNNILSSTQEVYKLIPDVASLLRFSATFSESANQLMPLIIKDWQIIRSLNDLCRLITRYPEYQSSLLERLVENRETLLTNQIPDLTGLINAMQENSQQPAIIIPFLLTQWTLFGFYVFNKNTLLRFFEAFQLYAKDALRLFIQNNNINQHIETVDDLCSYARIDSDLLNPIAADIFSHTGSFFRLFTDLNSFLVFNQSFPEIAESLMLKVSTEKDHFFHLIKTLSDLSQLIEKFPGYRLGLLSMLDNNQPEFLAMVTDLESLQLALCLGEQPEAEQKKHRQLLKYILTNDSVFAKVISNFEQFSLFLSICQELNYPDLVISAVRKILGYKSISEMNLKKLIADYPGCEDIIFVGLLTNMNARTRSNMSNETTIASLFPNSHAYKNLNVSIKDFYEQLRQCAKLFREQEAMQFSFFSRVPVADEILTHIGMYLFGAEYKSLKLETLYHLLSQHFAQDNSTLGCETADMLAEVEQKTSEYFDAISISRTARLAYAQYRDTRTKDKHVYLLLEQRMMKYTQARIEAKLKAFAKSVLSQGHHTDIDYGYLNQSLRKAIINQFGKINSISDVRQIEAAIMGGFREYLVEFKLETERFSQLPTKTEAWIVKGLKRTADRLETNEIGTEPNQKKLCSAATAA